MEARTRRSWRILCGLAILASAPSVAMASHHVFSSSVERFEIDGNTFGPADGTLDYVDEFDDGTIAPDWAPLLGTNVESGGVVTLKNPGGDITIGTTSIDVSNIENEQAVEDGAGNFTASSYWVPVLPTVGNDFHFQLYALSSTIESAGLSVSNGTAGPFITEQLTQIIFPSSFNNLLLETVPIDPDDITGSIVLRITVDDSTNTAVVSFSLDGGTTFQSPFSPMPVFNAVSDYELLVGAGSVTDTSSGPTPTPTPSGPTPTPTPVPTPQMVGAKLFVVKNPGAPSARKIGYKVKQVGPMLHGNPLITGATVRVKVDNNEQCFSLPYYGWSTVNGGYKYSDRYGYYGPVKTAKIQRSLNGIFQIKVNISGENGLIAVFPPNPGTQGDTNFSIGGIEYCSTTAGALIKPNTGEVFKARNTAPPLFCHVPACP